jgi:hypothetical protein
MRRKNKSGFKDEDWIRNGITYDSLDKPLSSYSGCDLGVIVDSIKVGSTDVGCLVSGTFVLVSKEDDLSSYEGANDLFFDIHPKSHKKYENLEEKLDDLYKLEDLKFEQIKDVKGSFYKSQSIRFPDFICGESYSFVISLYSQEGPLAISPFVFLEDYKQNKD